MTSENNETINNKVVPNESDSCASYRYSATLTTYDITDARQKALDAAARLFSTPVQSAHATPNNVVNLAVVFEAYLLRGLPVDKELAAILYKKEEASVAEVTPETKAA